MQIYKLLAGALQLRCLNASYADAISPQCTSPCISYNQINYCIVRSKIVVFPKLKALMHTPFLAITGTHPLALMPTPFPRSHTGVGMQHVLNARFPCKRNFSTKGVEEQMPAAQHQGSTIWPRSYNAMIIVHKQLFAQKHEHITVE